MIILISKIVLFMVGDVLCLFAGILVKDILSPKIQKADKTMCIPIFFIVSALGIVVLFGPISFVLGKMFVYSNFISSIITAFVYLSGAIGGYLLRTEKLYK